MFFCCRVGWPSPVALAKLKKTLPGMVTVTLSGGRTNLEEPMAECPELLGLATEIISGHVSNNAIAADQLPGLIANVVSALASVEQATAAPPKAELAVRVKSQCWQITSPVSIAASAFPC
jgi:hypothetical protein